MKTGRLAPSPTGAQHLGNARTFLIAYWAARHEGSRLVLRIEDIDTPRVKPWAVQQAIDDLRWLGIRWDAGPDIGGPDEPYIQTQRVANYHAALESLIAADRLYPCTCTRRDIQVAGSAPHFAHEGPVYPGTCAGWRRGDPLPPEGTYCWRFRAGRDTISFVDRVAGRQTCVPADDLGDFPVTQKDGTPAYQLAVVVDDVAMGITNVVRGNDLIPSTFRQIEIYRALQFEIPEFAHVPLVRGPDNRRLAKRHGDTRLSQYRQQSLSPSRIVTWAARSLGLIGPDRVLDNADDGIALFDWDRIPNQDSRLEPNEFAPDA